MRFGVTEAFYRLLRAEERLQNLKQDLELAEEFLRTTETRLAAGDIARVEVVRARVEAAQATSRFRAAGAAVRLARAALNVRLGRPQGDAIAITGQLKAPPLATPVEEVREVA